MRYSDHCANRHVLHQVRTRNSREQSDAPARERTEDSTHKSKADKRADGKRSRGGLLDLLRRLQFWNQQLKHQQR